MKRTFFHWSSSRSASSARRSRSDVCRAISGRTSVRCARRSALGPRPCACAQQPVDDEVGIAPDRRREVGVARERQAEVTEVRRRVARLLHGAQHRARRPAAPRACRGSARGAPGSDAAGPRAAAPPRLCPRLDDELLELLHLQRVGRLVHPVEPGNAARLEELRHRLVGEQHELLDDPVRDVPLRRDDRLDLPRLVEHDLGFVEVEVDRAEPPAPARAASRRASRIRSNIGTSGAYRAARPASPLEDGVHVGVGHPLARADDAVVELVPHHRPVPVHLHQARLDQAIDARIQAAQPGRQFLREHVQRPVREVHRRAAVVRLVVEGAALADVVRHVRDVHAEPEVPVRRAARSRSRRRSRARARRRS